MKKIYFLVVALCLFTSVNAQIINFPNANFKAKLLSANTTNTIAKDINGNNIKIDANNDSEIQISEALNISELNIRYANLTNLGGIEFFLNLRVLNCSNNLITVMNLSDITNLAILNCNYNRLTSLDLTGLSHLLQLRCTNNLLTILNLSNLNPNGPNSLWFIDCSNNHLTSIDLSRLNYLNELYCGVNNLQSLDIQSLLNVHNDQVRVVSCYQNEISSLDFSSFNLMENIFCNSNHLTVLNVSGLANLQKLYCDNNQLPSLNINGLMNLTDLNCSNNQLPSLDVSALNNLRLLNCNYNQLINLNTNGLNNLYYLHCSNNLLPSLNVNGLINLTTLNCSNNQLPSLNVNGLINLTYLYCSNNQLPILDVSGLTILNNLNCSNNQLPNLNISGLNNLYDLNCSFNQLPNLDVSGLNNLTILDCSHNQLANLNVSEQMYLENLISDNNQLTSLFIKNGSDESVCLSFSNNPNLQYICADENQIVDIQNKIVTYGYTNCNVGSYCSFTPGGTFYTIEGNNKYDGNNNGCDVLDLGLPNLKFNITDGTNTGSLISNTTGNYSIPVEAGTHTVTPVLENSTYFVVSPTNVIVDFPTQTSPFTQDFCVTANGVHPDLEVTILPINVARPGFDTTYKIIYKNKGNTTQSGTVNLVFNDSVLDLVVANPATTSQTTNNLSWDFTNLLPFESREISFTLNVNSPMETPAVNAGDILNYTTTITSLATDELPNDNTFVYNQTVVNSFDPNDITCLEGTSVSTTKIGDYVHYMIRFENNGTANAQNIVVKTMVDLAKYDINSIVPTKGSHSFVTNISAGNKVEFIFQNINLPYDDANNDGYISFKIKLKSTLVAGDTFSKNANIYFDYNFPIITNTATTTIAALSVQDFIFSNYFSVYPNPVHDVLNIATKESIEVSSINIYNTLGQLVLVIPSAKDTKTVDVSSLTTGNYFIKVNSDKGTSNTKFLKK